MGAVDYFLKIDGIEGESLDSKHSGEIEVITWSWSEDQTGTMGQGGGGGAGKVSMQDFSFTMYTCKASPKLLQHCASGKHVGSATLVGRKAGEQQQEYLKIKFTDILVSHFSTGGTGTDVRPVDSISLNFAKIEYEYKAQKKDGTLDGAITAGWDLKKNVKV